MAKRLHKSQWPNDKKPYIRDEEEIFSYDYEGTSDTRPISDISSFLMPNQVDSSKENVELSLEVEIADSLKHLIASPERKNSALLDVTIVRPTDLDFVRGLENSNTLAFKGSEVRNLIASMEREKQHKKKLIEECKKKVAAFKINPISETHETKGTANNKHKLTENEKRELHKHSLKRTENAKSTRNNIGVMSAPPKCNNHIDYRLNKKRNIANADIFEYKAGEIYTTSAPIAILKPLVGEIKQSLKNLEASLNQDGDHHAKHYTSTSDSSLSKDLLHYKHDKKHYQAEVLKGERPNTHQVYAAADNYDKLRNLLACQNPEQRDQDNEKPCLCQHCGMVGLLVESQKRPIITSSPVKKMDAGWPRHDNPTATEKVDHETHRMAPREMSKSRCADLKAKGNDDNFWIIRDLSARLEALEIRVAAQEQRAVPKDYFKRIINKLWHRNNPESQHLLQIGSLDPPVRFKDHSTQYSVENFENVSTTKKDPKIVKHRNVQIQQNSKRGYCINPVLIAHPDSASQSHSNDSQDLEFNKNVGTKAMTAIGEFFMKKTESNKKCTETNIPKEKSSPMESFWRWGEEIIKPGFDLKTKIMSLLDEQFHNIKIMKESDHKSPFSNKSPSKVSSSKSSEPKASAPKTSSVKTDSPKIDSPKTNLLETSSFRNNTTAPDHLFEAPLPFEDKEVLKNVHKNKNLENFAVPESSNRTLKKMLDMMSEKIYNDHVKPTVDAIKQEQKSFSDENSKEIYNIKAAMDAALYKINTKQTQKSKPPVTNEATIPCNGQVWRKDFLEPLEIPPSIKKTEGDFNDHSPVSKLSKKSAIPVRVSNTSPTDTTVAGNTKYRENGRSLIPRLKSPIKDCFEHTQQNQDNNMYIAAKFAKGTDKSQKKERHEKQQKKTTTKKLDAHHVGDSVKSKKFVKPVQIKYINPKIGHWNDESCMSLPTESSDEHNQVMLTDKSSSKCEKHRDNIKEEKRRISHKRSVTDKLAFLTNLTKAEMGKAHVWNNILQQAKNHCRSKQDTVIIQIPTKTHYKHNGVGITEVEFTIEDIQKLVRTSELANSVDIIPQESVESSNMESFLLIRSKKILEEVHRRLGNKFMS